MKRDGLIRVSFLAAAAILASGPLRAQGYLPPKELREQGIATPSAARAEELAQLDTWLRRVRGRYRIVGQLGVPNWYTLTPCEQARKRGNSCRDEAPQLPQPLTIRGSAECIGTGPGTSCVIDRAADMPPVWFPQVILFGIDPDALTINSLVSDRTGVAEAVQASARTTTVGSATRDLIKPRLEPEVKIDMQRRPSLPGKSR